MFLYDSLYIAIYGVLAYVARCVNYAFNYHMLAILLSAYSSRWGIWDNPSQNRNSLMHERTFIFAFSNQFILHKTWAIQCLVTTGGCAQRTARFNQAAAEAREGRQLLQGHCGCILQVYRWSDDHIWQKDRWAGQDERGWHNDCVAARSSMSRLALYQRTFVLFMTVPAFLSEWSGNDGAGACLHIFMTPVRGKHMIWCELSRRMRWSHAIFHHPFSFPWVKRLAVL